MLHRQSLILSPAGLEEVEQRQALAVGVASDLGGVCRQRGCGNRAGGVAGLNTQVRPRQVFQYLLKRAKVKHLVLYDGAADGAAKLLATKVLQWLAVRCICGKSFQPLVVEKAAVYLVSAGFRNHVHHAAGAASKFRAGAAGDHLKFFDRVESDVNGGALAPDLFTKEAVVVVAAIKADIVEYAALAGKADFVAIRALYHAYAGREGEQVFKLAAKDRRLADGVFVQRGAGSGLRGLNDRGPGDLHYFIGGRNLERHFEIQRLTHSQFQVLLHQLGKASLGRGDRIPSGGEREKNKATVAIGFLRGFSLRVRVHHRHIGAGQDRSRLVKERSLDGAGGNLRLPESKTGESKPKEHE